MNLKPCPFCGRQPVVQTFKICTTIRCQCYGNCYAYDEDATKAEEKWNLREELPT
jgi:Lar family restriction alleviation protein